MKIGNSDSSRGYNMGKGPEVWYEAICEGRMKVLWPDKPDKALKARSRSLYFILV